MISHSLSRNSLLESIHGQEYSPGAHSWISRFCIAVCLRPICNRVSRPASRAAPTTSTSAASPSILLSSLV